MVGCFGHHWNHVGIERYHLAGCKKGTPVVTDASAGKHLLHRFLFRFRFQQKGANQVALASLHIAASNH